MADGWAFANSDKSRMYITAHGRVFEAVRRGSVDWTMVLGIHGDDVTYRGAASDNEAGTWLQAYAMRWTTKSLTDKVEEARAEGARMRGAPK